MLLRWSLPPVIALVALPIVLCVFVGGAISAGAAGFAKLLIASAALLVFGIVAIHLAGGITPLQEALPANYFSLFGNGSWKDVGNGLGISFGVLTTQVYVQAVLSGRDARQARVGALVCGLVNDIIWSRMTTPCGASVFIGLVGSLFGLFAGQAISGALGERKTTVHSVIMSG